MMAYLVNRFRRMGYSVAWRLFDSAGALPMVLIICRLGMYCAAMQSGAPARYPVTSACSAQIMDCPSGDGARTCCAPCRATPGTCCTARCCPCAKGTAAVGHSLAATARAIAATWPVSMPVLICVPPRCTKCTRGATHASSSTTATPCARLTRLVFALSERGCAVAACGLKQMMRNVSVLPAVLAPAVR